jgi:hypothetical protein
MQYKSHQKIAELLFADAVKKAGGREVRVVRVSGDAHNLRIQQDGVQPEQLDTHLSQFEREEHEKFLHRAKTLFLEISSRLDGAVAREIFEEVISGRTRAKSYPKDFDRALLVHVLTTNKPTETAEFACKNGLKRSKEALIKHITRLLQKSGLRDKRP